MIGSEMASLQGVTLCVVVAVLTATGVLSQTVAPPSFSVRPRDTDAARGHDAILYCTVANLGSRHEVFWNIDQRTADNDAVNEFTIGPNVNVHSSYPRFQFEGDRSEGVFNLRISDVEEEDGGTYTCLVHDRNNPSSPAMEAGAVLTVINSPVAPMPGFPTCSKTPDPNSLGFYNDSQVLTLTCMSKGGVPLPDLSWVRVRDNNAIETLPIRSVVSGDVVTAEAKVHLSSVDHKSFYRCIETHPSHSGTRRSCTAPSTGSGPQPSLEVRFKPAVRISPNAVNVQLFETVTVDLRCEAYANPPLSNTPVIILPGNKSHEVLSEENANKTAVRVELTTEDVGKDFYCRAINEIGVGEAKVDIQRLGVLPTWLTLVVIGAIGAVLFIFIVVIACTCCVDRSEQEDEKYNDGLRYSVTRSRRRRDGDDLDSDYIDGFENGEIIPIEDFEGGQELAEMREIHKDSRTSNDYETGESGPRYQNVNEAFQTDNNSFSLSNPSSSEPIIDTNSE